MEAAVWSFSGFGRFCFFDEYYVRFLRYEKEVRAWGLVLEIS